MMPNDIIWPALENDTIYHPVTMALTVGLRAGIELVQCPHCPGRCRPAHSGRRAAGPHCLNSRAHTCGSARWKTLTTWKALVFTKSSKFVYLPTICIDWRRRPEAARQGLHAELPYRKKLRALHAEVQRGPLLQITYNVPTPTLI
jgi:hypothetical protein